MISKRITNRILFFEQLLIFITGLKERLNYTLSSLSELLHSDQKMLAPVLEALVEGLNGCGIKTAAQRAVASIPQSYGLNEGDKELVCDFFSLLGTSDCDSQTAHCELYISLIEQMLSSQKDEAAKKSRLMRLLGIFSGIGIGLFFL